MGPWGPRGGPMGSQGGGPWDPRVGGPWDPKGETYGIPGFPSWALGDPLALGDPWALGDPGLWGRWALGPGALGPQHFDFAAQGLRAG